jgi:mannose-6-phosphate isomerase-like protein (cupin superfamily)
MEEVMGTPPGIEGLGLFGSGNGWFNGAEGERQAIRVDSRDTQGTYSVVETVAAPGRTVPTHSHRHEEEHFLVISGRYRIAIGDQILDAPPGTRATVPRNTPHSWRNIAAQESRLLAILPPGGFEQIIYRVKYCPPERIPDLAAEFGCDILGPPVAE